MKSTFSWLVTSLVVIFWIFRVVVAMLATLEIDFAIIPADLNTEIILVFVAMVFIILTYKRMLLGGIGLLGIYGYYFGGEIVRIINQGITVGFESLTTAMYTDLLVAGMAMLLVFLNMFDLIFLKNRSSKADGKKVNWFYENENYDREKDDRDDNNNYRIY